MQKVQIKDKQLIKQYLDGNEACLEMIINRHKDRIFTTIIMVVQDRYIAEDIFQETFIKVIKTLKKGKYNEEGKFLPWILRIAKNLAIDHFRKKKRLPTITGQDGEDVFRTIQISTENREDRLVRTEKEDLVRELVSRLPEEQREVLIMRHYAEMSFKEIAETTDVSINTALGRMRYALNNLRKMMGDKATILRD